MSLRAVSMLTMGVGGSTSNTTQAMKTLIELAE